MPAGDTCVVTGLDSNGDGVEGDCGDGGAAGRAGGGGWQYDDGHGVVGWWSGGGVEWWSGGVVEWWSATAMEWWSGGV